MQISVSEEIAGFVKEQMGSGRFASESELVEAALRQMRDRAKKVAAIKQTMVDADLMETLKA